MPNPTELREFMERYEARKSADADKLAMAEKELSRRLSTLPSHPGWSAYVTRLEEEIMVEERALKGAESALLSGPNPDSGPHWYAYMTACVAARRAALEAFKNMRAWAQKAITYTT